jgi:hypothetical protein
MAMLALLLLAEIATRPTVASAAPAVASVRINRPAEASKAEWERTPRANRREIVRRDADGRPILVRVIEHE